MHPPLDSSVTPTLPKPPQSFPSPQTGVSLSIKGAALLPLLSNQASSRSYAGIPNSLWKLSQLATTQTAASKRLDTSAGAAPPQPPIRPPISLATISAPLQRLQHLHKRTLFSQKEVPKPPANENSQSEERRWTAVEKGKGKVELVGEELGQGAGIGETLWSPSEGALYLLLHFNTTFLTLILSTSASEAASDSPPPAQKPSPPAPSPSHLSQERPPALPRFSSPSSSSTFNPPPNNTTAPTLAPRPSIPPSSSPSTSPNNASNSAGTLSSAFPTAPAEGPPVAPHPLRTLRGHVLVVMRQSSPSPDYYQIGRCRTYDSAMTNMRTDLNLQGFDFPSTSLAPLSPSFVTLFFSSLLPFFLSQV